MLMKANNAYAIFFYHTLRYKINYTSVRRLCKINMLRMQDLIISAKNARPSVLAT